MKTSAICTSIPHESYIGQRRKRSSSNAGLIAEHRRFQEFPLPGLGLIDRWRCGSTVLPRYCFALRLDLSGALFRLLSQSSIVAGLPLSGLSGDLIGRLQVGQKTRSPPSFGSSTAARAPLVLSATNGITQATTGCQAFGKSLSHIDLYKFSSDNLN